MISEKKIFRQNIRQELNELSVHEIKTLSNALSINLFRFLNQENVIQKLIGAYAPFEQEPIWYESLDAEKLTLCFPAALSEITNEMVFKSSKLGELELRNDFGSKILGPKLNNQIVNPDLILVPGLAFTRSGERLGRGRGYFDRYLENFQGIKIGLAFEVQLKEQLPVEPHDVKVDWIITEKNIYKK